MGKSLKPFDVFICYKKNSGKDFAEHLKSGLEELGLHSFIDSKDIPRIVNGRQEWERIRDRAIEESKTFILLITPGFDLSSEVIKEISLARKAANKQFIYFRHRNLARKIVLDLGENEKVDLGKQEQVSFESKEELLRLAHNLLFKGRISAVSTTNPLSIATASEALIQSTAEAEVNHQNNVTPKCLMCSKPILGKAHVKVFKGKTYTFDSQECANSYKKLKSLYGEYFE
jgi:YHS domain-containing protein